MLDEATVVSVKRLGQNGLSTGQRAEMRCGLSVEQQMSAPKEQTDRRMKATTASPTAVQVE